MKGLEAAAQGQLERPCVAKDGQNQQRARYADDLVAEGGRQVSSIDDRSMQREEDPRERV